MGKFKDIIVQFMDAVYQFYNSHSDLTDIDIENVVDANKPYINITFWSETHLVYKKFEYWDIEHMYKQLGYISDYEFEKMYKRLMAYKNRKEHRPCL